MITLSKKTAFLILTVLFTMILVTSVGAADTEITDVVLVLEASKGEGEAEKITGCEYAAEMLVDMLPYYTRVSVVSYGRYRSEYAFTSPSLDYLNTALGKTARSRICLIQSPTLLTSYSDRENVKNSISELYDTIRQAEDISYTYLGGGMMASVDVLTELHAENAAIIVLSDGRISGFTASPYSNYELIGMAADTAEQNGWSLYAVETNDGSVNSPTSMARSVMYQLVRDRSHLYELTSFDRTSFAVPLTAILADFMNADTESYPLSLSGGSAEFVLSVPEAVSETAVLLTGGNLTAVEVDGAFPDETQVRLIRNPQYTMVCLPADDSGQHKLTVHSQSASRLQVSLLHYYDLPIAIKLSSGQHSLTGQYSLTVDTEVGGNVSVTRNNSVAIDVSFVDSQTGKPVSEPTFYQKNPVEIRLTEKATGQSQILPYTADTSGYHASVDFPNPADYEITATLTSDNLRTGYKTDSVSLTVENYQMEVAINGHETDTTVTCDETLTVQTYLTDILRGRLTDIYRDGEAFLTVRRDGRKIAEGIPMTAGSGGYFYNYTPQDIGDYQFEVTCQAACFAGIPQSMTKQSESYRCEPYRLQSEWKVRIENNPVSDYPDNGNLMKNDILTVQAELLSYDGKPLSGSRYYCDGSISLIITRDETVIDKIPLHYESDGRFTAEWLIHNAGELVLTLAVNDTVRQLHQKNAVVINHAPTLLQSEYKAEYAVGERWQIALSDYVKDEDGDYMEVAIKNMQSEKEKSNFEWSLSEDYKTVYLSAGNYKNTLSFVFCFYDGDTTVELPAKITVTNEKPKKVRNIELPHFLLEAWKIYEWIFGECPDEPVSVSLADYFTDPEGFPLSFTVTADTDMVTYDSERQLLTVTPTEAVSTKIRIQATDSSDESVSVTVPLQIDIWWKYYFRQIVVVLTAAALIFLAITWYILKNGMIGRLQIREGSYRNPTVNAVQKIDIDDRINRKNNKKSHQKISVFLCQRILNSDIRNYLKEHETGTLTGHLIFGSSVYLRNCQAKDVTDFYGHSVMKKKTIKLLAGHSYTLHYENDLTIRIANRNVGKRKRRRRRLF